MFLWLWLIVLFFCLFTSPVDAALPYPLEGLLGRAETVFIGHVTAQSDNAITLKVIKPMRGSVSGIFVFAFPRPFQKLDLKIDYLVISQGDHYWGPPESRISLGQEIAGQASYRGWIMFPVKQSGDGLSIDHIYSHVGQKTGHYSAQMTMKQLTGMIAASPYTPGPYANPRR